MSIRWGVSMSDEFRGPATPIDQIALQTAMDLTGAPASALWAVLWVETEACGFLTDRRPRILFERHKFSNLTHGRFDASNPGISARTPGGYGPGGAHQYDRLNQAIALDRRSALQSASWGLGQILGENCVAAGFPEAAAMASAFVVSEAQQLIGFARYLVSMSIASVLAKTQWTRFARLYNGPTYATNQYDIRLQRAFERFLTTGLPDLTVRAAQLMMTYRGHPLSVDGVLGPETRLALLAYQKAEKLPASGIADPDTLNRLGGI